MRELEGRSVLDPARLRRSVDWRLRLLSSPWRVLPDFVVLGAQRSGTTSLFDYLCHHPQVVPPYRKEIHFHDLHHSRGMGWYRAHFPLAVRMGAGVVTGEATPNYLVHPEAPGRLHAATPGARLLVMLRDPIERAHSAWRLRSSEGRETLTFADAVAREQRQPALLIGEYHENRKAVGDAIRFLYLAKSRYAEQLERWLELFPLEQFAVVTSEGLFEDPDAVLAELSRFLGIAVWNPASFPALNQTTPALIDPGLRQDLADYFAPHNRRLEALLGRDFGWN